MAGIHITDIEAAINHWRERAPASGGAVLAHEISALGEVYALMVYRHEDETDEHSLPAPARAAWLAWLSGDGAQAEGDMQWASARMLLPSAQS